MVSSDFGGSADRGWALTSATSLDRWARVVWEAGWERLDTECLHMVRLFRFVCSYGRGNVDCGAHFLFSTTPFFNIYSACSLFERRVATLPLLKDWKAECGKAERIFRVQTGPVLGGVRLPAWAMVRPPRDDGVFDVEAVVLGASLLFSFSKGIHLTNDMVSCGTTQGILDDLSDPDAHHVRSTCAHDSQLRIPVLPEKEAIWAFAGAGSWVGLCEDG